MTGGRRTSRPLAEAVLGRLEAMETLLHVLLRQQMEAAFGAYGAYGEFACGAGAGGYGAAHSACLEGSLEAAFGAEGNGAIRGACLDESLEAAFGVGGNGAIRGACLDESLEAAFGAGGNGAIRGPCLDESLETAFGAGGNGAIRGACLDESLDAGLDAGGNGATRGACLEGSLEVAYNVDGDGAMYDVCLGADPDDSSVPTASVHSNVVEPEMFEICDYHDCEEGGAWMSIADLQEWSTKIADMTRQSCEVKLEDLAGKFKDQKHNFECTIEELKYQEQNWKIVLEERDRMLRADDIKFERLEKEIVRLKGLQKKGKS